MSFSEIYGTTLWSIKYHTYKCFFHFDTVVFTLTIKMLHLHIKVLFLDHLLCEFDVTNVRVAVYWLLTVHRS